MQAAGVPVEQVKQWRQQQQQQHELRLVDVMADNWPAVEVFRRCRLGVSVGYGGAIYTSIPRADISAMLDEIDLGDVPRLAAIDGVMVIESVALSELNSRA